MSAFIRQHPLLVFYGLACAITWPCAALIGVSYLFPFLGLFGPALAAVAVLAVTDGAAGVRALFRRFPRPFGLHWALVAVALPPLLLVAVWALLRLAGLSIPFRLGPITSLQILLAVLVVGEEIGWRGYLLPRLLARRTPLASGVIVGVAWAFWHLPNFLLPDFPHHGLPFAAFALIVTASSILFTWLFLRTSGSLLAALLFHASMNLFWLTGVDPAREHWLRALVYGVVAAGVAWLARLGRRGGAAAHDDL